MSCCVTPATLSYWGLERSMRSMGRRMRKELSGHRSSRITIRKRAAQQHLLLQRRYAPLQLHQLIVRRGAMMMKKKRRTRTRMMTTMSRVGMQHCTMHMAPITFSAGTLLGHSTCTPWRQARSVMRRVMRSTVVLMRRREGTITRRATPAGVLPWASTNTA
jgi:hypothetical protein